MKLLLLFLAFCGIALSQPPNTAWDERGSAAPSAGKCAADNHVGRRYTQTTAVVAADLVFFCVKTGGSTYQWLKISAGVATVAGGASGSIVCTGTSNVLCDVDPGYAATLNGTNNFLGIQNAAGATATSPIKVATSDPATCTVGEYLYRSDLQQTKFCSATNTWTVLGSSGFNRTTAYLDEEFCGLPANGDRNFTLGWQAIVNGGVQDGGANEADADHPCVAAVYANSAANSITGFVLRWNTASNAAQYGVLGGFNANKPSEYYFIAKVTDITQVNYRIGLMNADTAALPNDGLFFQFANNSGCTLTGSDTEWQVFSRASSTSTPVTSGVTVTANTWYTFRIRSTTPGTWLFSVSTNGGAFSTEVSRSTNVPSARLSPAMFVVGCTGGLRYLHLDKFATPLSGLNR